MPVFQPGTVTLFSGVKRSCPLEVFAKNCGQNGPILGMSCALFLAKFMAHLSAKYQQIIEEEEKNLDEFDAEVYQKCIIEMLTIYAEEDADNHGRLIELKKLCLDVNNAENIELEEEDEKKFTLNDLRVYKEKTGEEDKEGLDEMRQKFVYYSDWENLFFEENTTKIHEELLPKIEKEILMKKGIFPNLHSYDILETHFDIIRRQLKQFDEFDKTYVKKISKKKKIELEKKQLEDFRKKKKQGKGGKEKKKDKTNKEKKKEEEEERKRQEEEERRKKEEEEEEEKKKKENEGDGDDENKEGEEEQQEEEKKEEEKDPFYFEENPLENQRFFINNNEFYFDYDISSNSRLSDYFNRARRCLKSLIVCGNISDTSLLSPTSISSLDILNNQSSIFPIYSHILSSGNLHLVKIRDRDVRNLIFNITTFGVSYDDLAYHIAKGLCIVRRNMITTMEKFNEEDISTIGPVVVKNLRKSGLNDHQILGLVDAKYAEAACLRFMNDETFNYSNLLTVIFPYSFN